MRTWGWMTLAIVAIVAMALAFTVVGLGVSEGFKSHDIAELQQQVAEAKALANQKSSATTITPSAPVAPTLEQVTAKLDQSKTDLAQVTRERDQAKTDLARVQKQVEDLQKENSSLSASKIEAARLQIAVETEKRYREYAERGETWQKSQVAELEKELSDLKGKYNILYPLQGEVNLLRGKILNYQEAEQWLFAQLASLRQENVRLRDAIARRTP